jgi:hypothetical protein
MNRFVGSVENLPGAQGRRFQFRSQTPVGRGLEETNQFIRRAARVGSHRTNLPLQLRRVQRPSHRFLTLFRHAMAGLLTGQTAAKTRHLGDRREEPTPLFCLRCEAFGSRAVVRYMRWFDTDALAERNR